MKKFQQKPRQKFDNKNKNFKSRNLRKVNKKKPTNEKPPAPVVNSVSIIKKSLLEKPKEKVASKLPGIQNFWKPPAIQAETKKRELDDDENSKDNKKQRLTGAERYQRYIDEEERIRKIEDELADPNVDPHTPDQFERALMKDRNSSFMWIKYMAFHLETAETEKARAVAKKAIASINFREEGELLNIWMALLNLEIRYGTNETYEETLRESVQRNDPFKVYSRALTILLEMEKFDEAGNIIETLKKKFKPLPDMWLQISEAYLKMKNEKMAKELLPKSLLSLKDKDRKSIINLLLDNSIVSFILDVEFMVKYALMTSKYDLHDFSQTIFEKILSSYNKKLPIWFTYIDMMIKNGLIDIARSLYERILVIKFPIKKLKTIIQRYIEFEMKHGEASNVSKIKKIARNLLEQDNLSD